MFAKKPFELLVVLFGVLCLAGGSSLAANRPLLGAQIWIEPGQTDAEIDVWFRQLAQSHMPVARIFVMWSYLEPRPGEWDFSLYDAAFHSAEKYHVAIVATLTPSGPPPFAGGDGNQGVGMVVSQQRKMAASEYIHKVVERYRHSPALDSWLLVNEPGQSPSPDPLAIAAYKQWLPQQYASVSDLNRSWGSAWSGFQQVDVSAQSAAWNKNASTDWMTFWRGYQTQELQWLATEVRGVDSAHPLHVNPHALVSNLAALSDNLPEWRGFLDSLGCSIHPAWHFGLLARDRYALGVSYVNALVRGSIEPKPYWVTELQGGNNIYSSLRPMDPTTEDIAQWVWTSVGSGADRVIFWLLNARRAGVEAGEWSLLDFQQQPSARLKTASAIAQVINDHQEFFAKARPVQSPVTLILSLETMTLEVQYADADSPGRDRNAHILETLGFYEALSQTGIPPAIKHFGDYDWGASGGARRIAILPDVRALTSAQVDELRTFVKNGNMLIASGLTGFYDPHALAWPLAGFPLGKVTGADLKEVHFVGEKLPLPLTDPAATLPSHLWYSTLLSRDAKPVGTIAGEVIATRLDVGKGSVLWIPSPIGMGAWLNGAGPLATFLQQQVAAVAPAAAFRFPAPQPGCLMQVLENHGAYVAVVTNGGDAATTCELESPAGLHPTTLWGQPLGIKGRTFSLSPRATAVVLYGGDIR
jgi:beta-galactosidase